MKFKILKREDSIIKPRKPLGDIEIPNELWKEWYNINIELMKEGDYRGSFDVMECQECGIISPNHLIEFLKYNNQKND